MDFLLLAVKFFFQILFRSTLFRSSASFFVSPFRNTLGFTKILQEIKNDSSAGGHKCATLLFNCTVLRIVRRITRTSGTNYYQKVGQNRRAGHSGPTFGSFC